MQPVPVFEKHLVFKPNKAAGSTGPVQGGSGQDAQRRALQAQTQGDLFYIQLVADVSDQSLEEASGGGMDIDMDENDNKNLNTGHTSSDKTTDFERWTLQFRDIPEVTRQRPVTSRLISDVPITSGDPMNFMSALNYSYVPVQLLICYLH